jgi:hypothetical protein
MRIKRGNSGVRLRIKPINQDGELITTISSAVLRICHPGGKDVSENNMIVTEDPVYRVEYTFVGTEFSSPGLWEVSVWIILAEGQVISSLKPIQIIAS